MTDKVKKRILIDVSEKFHADIKRTAAQKKKSIRQLVVDALCYYLIQQEQE